MRARVGVLVAVAVAVTFLLGGAFPAGALPAGSLDGSFGAGGVVVANFSDFTRQCSGDNPTDYSCGPRGEQVVAMVGQADGGVVITTTFSRDGGTTVYALLERFGPDGRWDPTFGTGGGAVVGPIIDGSDASWLDLRGDDAGRLYLGWRPVGGTGAKGQYIRRFDAHGRVDTGWGQQGTIVTVDRQPWMVADDGTLFELGPGPRLLGWTVTRVFRHGSTGAVDRTFGSNGAGILLFPSSVSGLSFYGFDDMAATASGGVVLVGSLTDSSSPLGVRRVVLGGLTATGQPDLAFGSGGVGLPVPTPQIPHLFDFAAVVISARPDGRFLIGGSHATIGVGATTDLVMLSAAGKVDTTFGTGGLARIDFSSDTSLDGTAWPHSIDLDHQGRTLVASGVVDSGSQVLGVARLDAGGALDPSFGVAGRALTPILATSVYTTGTAPAADNGFFIGSGRSTSDRQCSDGDGHLQPCSDLVLIKLRG